MRCPRQRSNDRYACVESRHSSCRCQVRGHITHMLSVKRGFLVELPGSIGAVPKSTFQRLSLRPVLGNPSDSIFAPWLGVSVQPSVMEGAGGGFICVYIGITNLCRTDETATGSPL